MTESAKVCARLSAIRSSTVGGSSGHARIAMRVMCTGTASASAAKLSPAPRAAAARTRSTSATASGSDITRAPGVSR